MKFDDDEFYDETSIEIMGFSIDTSIDWNQDAYEEKKKKILKGSINNIKGNLSEYIVYMHLVEQNYNVENYAKLINCINDNEEYYIKVKTNKEYHDKLMSGEYDKKHWNGWLGSSMYLEKNRRHYIDVIQRFGAEFIFGVKNLYNAFNSYGMKNNCPRYIPDFVAQKEEDRFVVEVKSYTKRENRLPKHQKESLELSKDLGFQPILVSIPMQAKLNIKEGEPSFIFL